MITKTFYKHEIRIPQDLRWEPTNALHHFAGVILKDIFMGENKDPEVKYFESIKAPKCLKNFRKRIISAPEAKVRILNYLEKYNKIFPDWIVPATPAYIPKHSIFDIIANIFNHKIDKEIEELKQPVFDVYYLLDKLSTFPGTAINQFYKQKISFRKEDNGLRKIPFYDYNKREFYKRFNDYFEKVVSINLYAIQKKDKYICYYEVYYRE